MAVKLINGELTAGHLIALNFLHEADAYGTTAYHYDGPNHVPGTNPQEQVLPITLSMPIAPATLDDAIKVLNEAKRLHNTEHITWHNASSGRRVFAHKGPEDAVTSIATDDIPPGGDVRQAMVNLLVPLTNELMTRYDSSGHRLNKNSYSGSTVAFHAVTDTTHALGTTTPLYGTSTGADIAARLNLLTSTFDGHFTDATSHTMADAVAHAAILTLTPVSDGNDWDRMFTNVAALRSIFLAHESAAGVHAIDDMVNVFAASAPSYPSYLIGAGTIPRTFKTAFNSHLTSTTSTVANHPNADGANTLTYANPTTIAGVIAAAAEIWTKQTAHMRGAPISRAVTLVAP
jgi:hypothetical protein